MGPFPYCKPADGASKAAQVERVIAVGGGVMTDIERRILEHIRTFGPARCNNHWDIGEGIMAQGGEFIHPDDIDRALASLSRQGIIRHMHRSASNLGWGDPAWERTTRRRRS